VPGVREVTPVPPRFAMYMNVISPQMAVICVADEPLLAGTVTVR
jgi:hypothetical protein